MNTVTYHSVQGDRTHQEDRFMLREYEDPTHTLAAVWDGHGGDVSAQELLESCEEIWDTTEDMVDVFSKMAEKVEHNDSGATCSIVNAYKDRAQIAILGDSPVIAKALGKVIIYPVHNARTNREEREAAMSRGAVWDGAYLMEANGYMGLQISRSLGDYNLRSFLSRVPDIHTIDSPWEWILIGTDGMFSGQDVSLANPDVSKAISMMNKGATAEDIVMASIKADNVTAIVIRK